MGFPGQIPPPSSPPGQALKRVSGFPREESICYSTSQPTAPSRQKGEKSKSHKFLDATNGLGCYVWLSPASSRQPPQPQHHQGGGNGRVKAPGRQLQPARPQQARGITWAPPGRRHPGQLGRAPHPRGS